jgi:hypothetical protein
MALDFDGNDGLRLAEAPVSTVGDKTYFAWIKPTTSTTNALILGAEWISGGGPFYQYMGLGSDNKLHFYARTQFATYNWGSVTSDETISDGAWGHVAIRLKGPSNQVDSMVLFVNGVKKISSQKLYHNNNVPNSYSIASDYGGDQYFDGKVMWGGVYDTQLSDSEIESLAAGMCPLLIRPSNLARFNPLGGLDGEHSTEIIQGASMSDIGSPTWSDDSPTGLIYPSQQIIGVSQGIITPAVQHARLRIGV